MVVMLVQKRVVAVVGVIVVVDFKGKKHLVEVHVVVVVVVDLKAKKHVFAVVFLLLLLLLQKKTSCCCCCCNCTIAPLVRKERTYVF